MLSIFLAVSIGLIGWNTYASWQEGPWDLPSQGKAAPPEAPAEKPATAARPAVGTDAIVSRNLFDPERGAGATREAEETSRAHQRVRGLILVGTVVIGNTRAAIIQDGAPVPVNPGTQPQTPATMRLKVGDNVEGYRLAEIADKKVVFTKDARRVEIALDYFRRVEVPVPPKPGPGQVITPGAAPPAGPRVIPNLPRRSRIPVPGSASPDS